MKKKDSNPRLKIEEQVHSLVWPPYSSRIRETEEQIREEIDDPALAQIQEGIWEKLMVQTMDQIFLQIKARITP